MEYVKIGVQVLMFVFMLAHAIFTWLAQRNTARAAEVILLANRVLVLEEKFRHLPDQDLVHELAGDMKAMKAELRGVTDALRPLVGGLDRINDYLLNHK